MCVLDRSADTTAEVGDLVDDRVFCRRRDSDVERAGARGELYVRCDRGGEERSRGVRALKRFTLCEDLDVSRALKPQRSGAHQSACAEARDLEPVIVEALSRKMEGELTVCGDGEVQDRGTVGAREAHHEGPL